MRLLERRLVCGATERIEMFASGDRVVGSWVFVGKGNVE